MAYHGASVGLGLLLLGSITCVVLWKSGWPTLARPDVDITIKNNCPFSVDVAWFETTECGPIVNMLLVRENIPSNGQVRRIAPKVVPYIGSRIYAWAVKGQIMPAQTPTPLPEDLFASYAALQTKDRCGAPYSQHRFGGLPQSFASFAELTFTDDGEHVFHDADISNVDGFYLPMGWEFSYPVGTPNPACHNCSLTAFPTEADCLKADSKWNSLQEFQPVPNAPTGWCQPPQDLCPYNVPIAQTPAICSKFSVELAPLTKQLDFSYAALQANKAFTWITRPPGFAGQLWKCNGFLNAPGFAMAEMCAAINRGACEFSALGSLSPDAFKQWIDTQCGPTQNEDPSSWWRYPVRNPYAYWLRSTLGGSTYAFSQDEGLHGGNSNCNNNGGPASLPERSIVNVCPAGRPSAAPQTSSVLF